VSSSSSFINGTFVPSYENQLIIKNKFSNETLTSVSLCNDEQLLESVKSSEDAFSKLKSFTAQKRYDLLSDLILKVTRDSEEMAQLISNESGKPIAYAKAEVSRSIATLEFAREESRRIHGEVIPMDFSNSLGRKSFTKKFPLGPILAISPFNFPLNLALHKIAPALACGCSVVLKPSLFTPLIALKLAELIEECGYPKGTLNVVICDNEKSEKLVRDDSFKLLSFTGSPDVGWMLKSLAGKKKVVLELGGNAAVIVDKGTDLKSVASSVATGAFLYSGQICISTQRVICHEEIYEDFKTILVDEVEKLKVGDPKDADTIIGPLIDIAHVSRVETWVKESVDSGARVLCGAKRSSDFDNIYCATLLENVSRDQKLWTEEVFGPVAVLEKFSNFDEAIDLVNDSNFGLQVGVFTDSLNNMNKSFDYIEVAGVMINSVPGFRIDHMPYGGIKDSGLGREGVRYAIDDMTYEKLLVY
jgi:glyceraldehyde-3-phosphate dehydrogenase (NADP+)